MTERDDNIIKELKKALQQTEWGLPATAGTYIRRALHLLDTPSEVAGAAEVVSECEAEDLRDRIALQVLLVLLKRNTNASNRDLAVVSYSLAEEMIAVRKAKLD